MKRNTSVLHTVQWALVAAASLTAANLAVAQQNEGEVTIEAERPAKVVGRSYTGTPIEVATVTRKVRYADLDLTTHVGATELEKRVNETAKSLCKQLDKLYPNTASEGPDCVRKASKDAMVQANAAIETAAQRVHAR